MNYNLRMRQRHTPGISRTMLRTNVKGGSCRGDPLLAVSPHKQGHYILYKDRIDAFRNAQNIDVSADCIDELAYIYAQSKSVEITASSMSLYSSSDEGEEKNRVDDHCNNRGPAPRSSPAVHPAFLDSQDQLLNSARPQSSLHLPEALETLSVVEDSVTQSVSTKQDVSVVQAGVVDTDAAKEDEAGDTKVNVPHGPTTIDSTVEPSPTIDLDSTKRSKTYDKAIQELERRTMPEHLEKIHMFPRAHSDDRPWSANAKRPWSAKSVVLGQKSARLNSAATRESRPPWRPATSETARSSAYDSPVTHKSTCAKFCLRHNGHLDPPPPVVRILTQEEIDRQTTRRHRMARVQKKKSVQLSKSKYIVRQGRSYKRDAEPASPTGIRGPRNLEEAVNRTRQYYHYANAMGSTPTRGSSMLFPRPTLSKWKPSDPDYQKRNKNLSTSEVMYGYRIPSLAKKVQKDFAHRTEVSQIMGQSWVWEEEEGAEEDLDEDSILIKNYRETGELGDHDYGLGI